MSNLIIKNECLKCDNLDRLVEFGICSCGNNDYEKGMSQSMQSSLARHGKTGNKLLEIQKPLRRYKYEEIEEPLRGISVAMENLVNEGEKMCIVTKSLKEREVKRCRKIKIAKSKGRARSSISNMERSRAQLSWSRRQSLKKADNTVVLGTLDGSLKSSQIQGWIEKRAGV